MVRTILAVVFLLKFIAFTTQWNPDLQINQDGFYEFKKILKEFGIKINGSDIISRIKPKYYVSKKKHSDEENQNVNVQALNYLLKNDKTVGKPLEDIENDRFCKAGRCGCGKGGTRCSQIREDNDGDIVYNDGVRQLLNEIEIESTNRNNNAADIYWFDRTLDEFREKQQNSLLDEFKEYGKKYKLNDKFDAIVFDMPQLDEMLNKNDNSDELFKLNLNKVSNLDSGKILHNEATLTDVTGEDDDKLTERLKNLLQNESEKKISPEDLFTYYQFYKTFIIGKIMDYVKNKDGRKTEIQNVTEKQKRLINNVKHLTQNNGLPLNDNQIKKEIARIMFGKHSLSQVVPHDDRNNNIYVPKWFYKNVAKSKSASNLRVPKRLLPLTVQQRKRQAKKAARFWRRDSGPNVENYGVPFELQVQGLGQAIS